MRPKLFMTPALAKAGKLYSQIGNDFTVVRNLSASFRNASGLLEFAAPNVARIEYPAGGGCPYLLRDGESENRLIQSNSFDNAAFVKVDVSITPNNVLSPTGATNADTITLASGTVSKGIGQVPTIGLGVHTQSFFVHRSGLRFFQIQFDNTLPSQFCNFDLQDLVAGTPQGGAFDPIIEEWENGFVRIALSKTEGLSADRAGVLWVVNSLTDTTAQATSATGAFALYGAQCEPGALSSYIETAATAVTRPADLITATDEAGATTNTFVFEDGSTTTEAASGTITVPVGKISYIKQD